MSKKEMIDEHEVIDLIEQLESEYNSSDAALDSISDFDHSVQEEVANAMVAQQLLAQLETVMPPEDLPMKTARRARRRRRELLAKSEKNWLDQMLSVAIIVLIMALVSLVIHQLQDQWSRQNIEYIQPVQPID